MRRPAKGSQAAEARVLRRTRLRLVLWSAGSTLLVLLVMGGVLYGATAQLLAADAEAVLHQRADAVLSASVGGAPGQAGPAAVGPAPVGPAPVGPSAFIVGTDPAQPGLVVGGDVSGTIAVTIPDSGSVTAPALDPPGLQAALDGATVINGTAIMGVPMRVLSLPVPAGTGALVVQVASDRTTELRTLEGLAIVLIVGGAIAVLVAAAFGWLYAGRALTPVRESLRRQREFAADASHELRTPLAVIRGNLELLRADGRVVDLRTVGSFPAGVAAPGPLDEIESEVDRLSGLVDQLLLLARADSDALGVEWVEADLGAEAADASDALTPVAAARGVQLALDVEPVAVMGDRERLRQLVTILIDNAIRHAAPSGEVGVAVRARDDVAMLSVTDDGAGIRPQDLPRVFDRFWRATDAPEGGSGLGLAIAAWIAEQHDGAISAGNAPGGGARFEVRLPLA